MFEVFRNVNCLFLECIMFLGWTTGIYIDLSLSGYFWDNVLDMYYVVMDVEF